MKVNAETEGYPTVKELLDWAVLYLERKGIDDAAAESEFMLCCQLGMTRGQMIIEAGRRIAGPEADIYRQNIVKRGGRIPSAYISGEAPFMDMMLRVFPGVLIPRPETEILVEKAGEFLKGRPCAEVLDLGTGSGNISIALARAFPDISITSVEKYEAPFKAAEYNSSRYCTRSNIDFIQSDMADFIRDMPTGYDAVISNPPYVRSGMLDELAPEVQKEPRCALDGGEDGMDFIRKVIEYSARLLKPGGGLFIEIGYDQKAASEEIVRNRAGELDYEFIKDYNGLDRILVGIKNENGKRKKDNS